MKRVGGEGGEDLNRPLESFLKELHFGTVTKFTRRNAAELVFVKVKKFKFSC